MLNELHDTVSGRLQSLNHCLFPQIMPEKLPHIRPEKFLQVWLEKFLQ